MDDSSSHKLRVVDLQTDFRIERENPTGEANRLIFAISMTFVRPGFEGLFRRYYTYAADEVTPSRLADAFKSLWMEMREADTEMNANADKWTGKEQKPKLKDKKRHPRIDNGK